MRGLRGRRRRRPDQPRPEQDALAVAVLAGLAARGRRRRRCSARSGSSLGLGTPDRPQHVRARQGAQACGTSSASSFRRTSTSSPRRSAPGTASRARWASWRTRHRSPRSASSARVVTDEQLGIPLDEALEVTAKRMQIDRHGPGRRPRARPARGGRQHRGGARPGDREHPRPHGHPPARQGADRAGQVLELDHRGSCPSGIFIFLAARQPVAPRPAVPRAARPGRIAWPRSSW